MVLSKASFLQFEDTNLTPEESVLVKDLNPFVHTFVPQPQTKQPRNGHVLNLIIQSLSIRAEDCCGRGKTENRRGHVVLIACFEQLTVCLQISVDIPYILLLYYSNLIDKIFLKFPRFHLPDFKLVFRDKSFVRSGSSDV